MNILIDASSYLGVDPTSLTGFCASTADARAVLYIASKVIRSDMACKGIMCLSRGSRNFRDALPKAQRVFSDSGSLAPSTRCVQAALRCERRLAFEPRAQHPESRGAPVEMPTQNDCISDGPAFLSENRAVLADKRTGSDLQRRHLLEFKFL